MADRQCQPVGVHSTCTVTLPTGEMEEKLAIRINHHLYTRLVSNWNNYHMLLLCLYVYTTLSHSRPTYIVIYFSDSTLSSEGHTISLYHTTCDTEVVSIMLQQDEVCKLLLLHNNAT